MGRKTDKPVVVDDQAPAEDVSGDAVADYLRRHPDFFTGRLDLLSDMAAPDRWSDDSVVDMQRFLAERRLGEIDDLRNCAQEVIETSRTNMSVQTRTHAAVLAMLSAADLEHLLRVINDDLPLLLDVDVVTLGRSRNCRRAASMGFWGPRKTSACLRTSGTGRKSGACCSAPPPDWPVRPPWPACVLDARSRPGWWLWGPGVQLSVPARGRN